MRTTLAAVIVGGVALGLGFSPPAQASDAPVVLDLEGNPTCSSLTVNRISELRINSISSGTFTSGTQQVKVEFAGTSKIARWDVLPGSDNKLENVNFVIVKGSGSAGARVYHFGQTGRLFDEDEEPPRLASIAQVSFCYGLQGTSTVSDPPACSSLGINCTGNKVVFLFDLGSTFFDLQPCTCGAATLTACNPDATAASAATTTLPACVSSTKVLTEVPTLVEGVKNPSTYFCTTVGGKRTCYNTTP